VVLRAVDDLPGRRPRFPFVGREDDVESPLYPDVGAGASKDGRDGAVREPGGDREIPHPFDYRDPARRRGVETEDLVVVGKVAALARGRSRGLSGRRRERECKQESGCCHGASATGLGYYRRPGSGTRVERALKPFAALAPPCGEPLRTDGAALYAR